MRVLHACMYVHCEHAWCLQNLEGSSGSPITELMYNFKVSCGFWELNQSSLEKQKVFLTDETSFYSHIPHNLK